MSQQSSTWSQLPTTSSLASLARVVSVILASAAACPAFSLQHGLPGVYKFYGLDDVFPDCVTPAGKSLGELWDEDEGFRAAVRIAGRKDMFSPPENSSQKKLQVLKMLQLDMTSTASGRWDKKDNFRFLDDAFLRYELPLTGEGFVRTVASLSPASSTSDSSSCGCGCLCGSFLDISTAYTKPQNYAWHHDSHNDEQVTVMLGFPRCNGFQGINLFSHFTTDIPASLKALREGSNSSSPLIFEDEIEGEMILKPIYERSKEIFCYFDGGVLHSAPDVTDRCGVWRFM